MKQTKVWASVVVAAVVAALFASGLLNRPSDRELILTALNESIEASREGRPGGVLEYISQHFTVNDERYGTRDIARTIREMKPNIELERKEPVIEGDSATMTSPVKLSLSIPPVSYTVNQVTLVFGRESARKWLVFPTAKWRLTSVDIPAEVVEDARQQFAN